MINDFRGKYAFLSNFYDAPVEYNGLRFLNSEAAFQAQKTIDERERMQFTNLDASNSKRLGRAVTLRKDWEKVKIQVMYEVCYAKFTQNPRLAEKLAATGNEVLIEGNTWNDKFWGVCNGKGMNHLGKILMAIRTELGFDAPKVKDDIVNWIRNFFERNGKDCNAVIGISGGKDSSVVAALCVEALGKDRVIGVLMPNGVQKDMDDALEVVDFLGIKRIVVNIDKAVKGLINGIHSGWKNPKNIIFDISKQTIINIPPRIRMATLYAVSQSVNGRVANTCNLSEDWIGYSTRWGDSVGDFSPLANLTSDEVITVGIECGLPENLVLKTPSDGLCGMTDEDNFGFTYKVLNRYIRTGYCFDMQTKESIDNKHKRNLFKLQPIPSFEY
jgi:NAD+ synthase